MSIPPKDSSDVPVVVGRRSARLSVVVPITIRGIGPDGQPFKENTWTIGVNKQGAKIASFRRLNVGDQIIVENPVLGRTSKAHVVRVGEKRYPEDPYEVGIELNEAQNVWGVKFPPEDWQRNIHPLPAAGAIRRPEPASSAPPTPSTAPTEPAKPEAPETPAEAPHEPGEKFSPLNMAIAALSQYAEQEAKKEEAPPKPPEAKGKTDPLLERIEAPERLSIRAQVEKLGEKETALRTLRSQLDTVSETLQTTRSELEGLLTKSQEQQEFWREEMSKQQRELEAARTKALDAFSEDLNQKARVEVDSSLAQVVEQAQERLRSTLAEQAEASTAEIKPRLSSVAEETLAKFSTELQSLTAQQTEQVKRQVSETFKSELEDAARQAAGQIAPSVHEEIRKNADKFTAEFTADLGKKIEAEAQSATQTARDEMLAQLRAAGEQSVSEAAREAARRMRESSTEVLASLQASADEADKKLRALQQETQSVTGKAAAEFQAQISSASGSALAGFRNSTEAQLKAVQNEVQKSVAGLKEESFGDFSHRLHSVADEVLESTGKRLQQSAEDAMLMVSDKLMATEKQATAEIEAHLADAARRAREVFSQQAEEFRGRQMEMMRNLNDEALKEHAAKLHAAGGELREMIVQEIDRGANEAAEHVVGRIKSLSEEAVQQVSDAVHRQIGVGTVVLKDWADQTRTRLEISLRDSVSAFRAEVERLSRLSAERLQEDSRRLMSETRNRLQQAASLLELPPQEPK